MPIPPAAIARWKSVSSADTTAAGVRPSNVAAFTSRLRSVIGPNGTGSKIVTATSKM